MLENFTPMGYSLEAHLFAFILGSTRLMAFVHTAPFMGNAVIGQARMTIVFALYLVLHPAIVSSMPDVFPLSTGGLLLILGLVLKEAFLGFSLGWLAGLLFWTLQSAGFFIDNQRGAGMAQGTDPLSGDSASPIGSFLFQSLCFIFYSGGAFLALLASIYATYEFWPVGQALPFGFFENQNAVLFFGKCVAKLAADMVLLSAPVVLACLFTDLTLGIINRFASQLNVYILAMGIKSGLASFLLLIYLATLIAQGEEKFSGFSLDLNMLRNFF